MRERRIVALHQGADAWLRPTLAAAAIYLFRNTGYSALIGFLLGTLLVSLSQGLWTWRGIRLDGYWDGQAPQEVAVRRSLDGFFAYARPFVMWAGIAAVSAHADRWILQIAFGAKEVGIYAALYQIANAPISLLGNAINQFAVPIIFERAGRMTSTVQAEGSTRLLYQTLAVSGLFMLACTMGAYFFSEPLVRFLTSSVFGEHHAVLWVLVLGLSLFQLGQMFVTKGLCANQPNLYVLPKLLQAGAFLTLAYFQARLYGIAGVAWALCGSSLLYLASVLLVNTRLVHNVIEPGR